MVSTEEQAQGWWYGHGVGSKAVCPGKTTHNEGLSK